MTDFTFRQLQKCAAREVALRKNVFAKRGMTLERAEEIVKMEAIVAHFKDLADCDETAGRNPKAQIFFTLRDGKTVYLPMYDREKP